MNSIKIIILVVLFILIRTLLDKFNKKPKNRGLLKEILIFGLIYFGLVIVIDFIFRYI